MVLSRSVSSWASGREDLRIILLVDCNGQFRESIPILCQEVSKLKYLPNRGGQRGAVVERARDRFAFLGAREKGT